MAFRKALTSLFPTSLVVILIVLLMPFVLSSRIHLQAGTAMAENTATITVQGLQTQAEINRNEASYVTVEDSARQVPTGPDPLHHHNNPTRP